MQACKNEKGKVFDDILGKCDETAIKTCLDNHESEDCKGTNFHQARRSEMKCFCCKELGQVVNLTTCSH